MLNLIRISLIVILSLINLNSAATIDNLDRSKFMIKRNSIDLDYNQDLIAKFEHPNALINLNDKNVDSLENQLNNQQLNNQKLNSQLDQQPIYRQLSKMPNGRMTKIRFLVGSKLGQEPNEQANQDQLINDNSNESSESINQIKRSHLNSQDYDLFKLKRNLRNQLNNQFSYRMGNLMNNQDYFNRQFDNPFNNPMNFNQRMYQLNADQMPRSRRIKKALSLCKYF